jgi:hypothetical protein
VAARTNRPQPPTLVRQRIFQIACGYADQNDATTLRSDPLLKAVCGRRPETGSDLASQPTLSRLENAVDRHACEAMAEALVALYIHERQRAGVPSHLVLDIDGTDDPIHGRQEGGAYHGFYREHIYHPVLIFDSHSDQLITAVLRPGKCHESRFVVLILRRLLKRLRAAWPQVSVELRRQWLRRATALRVVRSQWTDLHHRHDSQSAPVRHRGSAARRRIGPKPSR